MFLGKARKLLCTKRLNQGEEQPNIQSMCSFKLSSNYLFHLTIPNNCLLIRQLALLPINQRYCRTSSTLIPRFKDLQRKTGWGRFSSCSLERYCSRSFNEGDGVSTATMPEREEWQDGMAKRGKEMEATYQMM
jgi:hypothetical protein